MVLPGPRRALSFLARALAWAYQTLMDSSMTLRMNLVPSVCGPEHGSLHGGGTQGRRPQLVAHRFCPFPHLVVEPVRQQPASRPPHMGLDRAGPNVGRRFGLRSTEEAHGVQHRVSVGGPVCEHSHRGDVVHAGRRNVALLVTIEPFEGRSTPRRVFCSPLGLTLGTFMKSSIVYNTFFMYERFIYEP